MEYNGVSDAQEWRVSMESTVIALVRVARAVEPTSREMGVVLDRVGRWDAYTRRVVPRCGDRDYALTFARALLRA
jgi:hypothetical protein